MKLGIKFGINAIMAGQKSSLVNATPQLIVKSTQGQFTITSPVSKALAIAAGENVMFFNNKSEIEAALNNPADEIVAYANEQGWDLNTREGADAFIKDQLVWYIAKGVLMFKRNGEPILGTVRITKEDKAAYIAEHGVEMIGEMSEEDKAKFAASKGLEGADDETLASALTPDDVPSPTFHAASGSKTAATANATGIGLQLNFTDTAIWDSMKSDLADKSSVNRVFNVKLDEAVEAEFNNGKAGDDGIVKVMAYPLEFDSDKTPMVRGKKDEAED
jgi:hypothetical protein